MSQGMDAYQLPVQARGGQGMDLDYPAILDLFSDHLLPGRTESAAFLIWYLENYYRLDEIEAVDAVCDQRGDRGIDGIYVNDHASTIDVFQSRISQNPARTVGDKALREFRGTLSQLASRDALENLLSTAGDAQVAQLVRRLDLLPKIEVYDVRGIYLTNIELDVNGQNFLQGCDDVKFVGKETLLTTFVSDARSLPAEGEASFDVSGFTIGEYIVDSRARAVIAPISARELVKMQGISDQSLYAFNVRASLGKTQVNAEIVKSISDQNTHKSFPLFHNGITIICQGLAANENEVRISRYYVVNGCQSLTALYENQKRLTDDLRILTKFVQVDSLESELSDQITRRSNNQNSVKARDFKANNPMQIRLQNEFRELYGGAYWFDIKRGEKRQAEESISNEVAGLYLMAFDLEQPWATHRKYEVFEEKHASLFGRPEVNADRIVMCHVIARVIEGLSDKIENKLFGKYVLTRYVLMFIVRKILDQDAIGRSLIANPGKIMRTPELRKSFEKILENVVNDVIVDLNHEVRELGEDFDYRGRLREAEWVKWLSGNLVSAYLKLVTRGRVHSITQEWQELVSA